MINVRNRKELVQFDKEASEAASEMRQQVALSVAADMCYYEGVQWLSRAGTTFGRTGLDARGIDYNPDSGTLRVTANRTTRLVQKVAAQTYPVDLSVVVPAPLRVSGPTGERERQTIEDVATAAVEDADVIGAHRGANMLRAVTGVGGIGLSMTVQGRSMTVNGREVRANDRVVKAFSFSPTMLILDPHDCQTKLDLHQHEYVGYRDVWTVHKIERELGVKLDPDECEEVGSLCQHELEVNALSQRRLYERFRRTSKTKGAIVKQWMIRDSPGRFGMMAVIIEYGGKGREGKDPIWVNEDAPENPFAGDGMPFALLHGHRRPDSIWSIGEARMVRDDQNRINLLETHIQRMLANSAGFKILVDSRSKGRMGDDDFRNQFTNRVSGPLWYDSGGPHAKINPPAYIQTPMPPPVLDALVQRYGDEMKQTAHRSDANFGKVLSHVPDATYQRAIDEADQVGNTRIREDMARVGRIITTLTATYIANAQAGSPSALGAMRKLGMGVEDLAVAFKIDPMDMGSDVMLRESSVRHRSHERRKQDLDIAVANKSISALDYRTALGKDLDAALTDTDRMFITEASRAADRVLMGEEWIPVPLGEYSRLFTDSFRAALFSDAAKMDPEASGRLRAAIQAQMMSDAQEVALMAAAENPQPARPEAAATPETASIADMLSGAA